ALLHAFRPDIPLADPQLASTADELGHLPLALHLAGSYLARYRAAISLETYLSELRRPDLLEHPSLKGIPTSYSPTAHERHVARTFAVSYERFDPSDPVDVIATKLLTSAAYFAPD